MTAPQVGDSIRLLCPVPAGSRIGAARAGLPIGAEGVIEQAYPPRLRDYPRVFEARFGERLVIVTLNEFTLVE